MVKELKNKSKILPRLYEDFVLHVEEISLIEETHLWHNVTVFVEDEHSMNEFLILHSPSFYWSGRSLSVYVISNKTSTMQKFAEILKKERTSQTHLQTSVEASQVRQFMPWLEYSYTVRYCRADSTTFKPHCKPKTRVIRLTPENIKKLDPSASRIPYFVKRLKTAPVYGYLNEKEELVATSGVGFFTKKSFSISYTETKPEYRNQGIAKCLTSLASEPLIKKGMVGVYAADVTNPSSLKVAEDLGFQPYMDLECFYN
jgi:predicted GNAT family acetyltransferase